jgi:hypothetical protein
MGLAIGENTPSFGSICLRRLSIFEEKLSLRERDSERDFSPVVGWRVRLSMKRMRGFSWSSF